MNWPAWEERIPGKLPGEAYILEMLNLEDIPDAYAFAIEKFSSRRQQRVLNSSWSRVARTDGTSVRIY